MSAVRSLLVLLLVLGLAGCASSQRTAPSSSEDTTAATADTSQRPTSETSEARASDDGAPSDNGASDPAEADSASVARGSSEAARDWFHRDTSAPTPGLSTDKAYTTLLANRTPKQTVTVAIIDSGIDIHHEDLQSVIWTNEDEIPDNGVDDDQNGYVDDMHGWNFIGGGDGENVEHDTYEVTRLYRKLHQRFADVDSARVPASEREAYARYQRIEAEFKSERRETRSQLKNVKTAYQAVQSATSTLKDHLGADTLTQDAVANVSSPDQRVTRARDILMYFYRQGLAPSDIKDYHDHLQNQVEYNYNPDFDPRSIVGDDYSDKTERVYGNNDVIGPDADHGTHVAGIVGAVRDNGRGLDGVATSVRLMSVRAVPNGDERDKDVANAIRYAVDNGADIINMSFGKSYSPHKEVVDAAVQYADSMGVLMVHAAGNDGANVDSTDNYPTRVYENDSHADLWVEVGASSSQNGKKLAAPFSNYGAETVDVFAPGTGIYSTVPNNRYKRNGGTSMAAPMVTGLAALIMAYHPDLPPAQVRSLILDGATPYGETQVTVPGGSRTVPFSSLSRTGAIVNAYTAIQRAARVN